MKRKTISLAIMLTALAGMAKDIRTLVVTTQPQMHCEACEKKIQGNLRFERGVKRIVTSVSGQTVTIQYDAEKTSADRLIKAFPKFGYSAKALPTSPGDSIPPARRSK